jgi:hypothetical protein
MQQRSVGREDIRQALMSASTAVHEVDRKWRLEGGVDTDGDPLGVVIVFTGRGLVVTVF